MPFLLIFLPFCGQLPEPGASPRNHTQLRQFVRTAMRYHPREVECAGLWIDNTTLYYRFGGLKELLDMPPSSPLEYPLAAQFRVEAIRAMMKENPWGNSARKVWEKNLAEVETIVGKELAAIAAHKEADEELTRRFDEFDEQIENVLLGGVRYLAKEERRKVAPMRTSWTARKCTVLDGGMERVTQAIEGFEVEITTNPEGGRISYMAAGKYVVAEWSQKLDEPDIWLNFPEGGSVVLNGTYVFRGTWPDGRTLSPTRYHFDHKNKLVLRPNSKPNPTPRNK